MLVARNVITTIAMTITYLSRKSRRTTVTLSGYVTVAIAIVMTIINMPEKLIAGTCRPLPSIHDLAVTAKSMLSVLPGQKKCARRPVAVCPSPLGPMRARQAPCTCVQTCSQPVPCAVCHTHAYSSMHRVPYSCLFFHAPCIVGNYDHNYFYNHWYNKYVTGHNMSLRRIY